MNLSDLKTYASYLLRDPLNGLFSESELTAYANEALDDLARECKYLEDYRYYALTNGTAVYTLDDDVLEVERVEINGKYINQLDVKDMWQYDANWLNEAGEVRRWYSYGSNKIGYYKKPSWTADLSTITSEYGMVTDMSSAADTFTFTDDYGVITDIQDSGIPMYFMTPDNDDGEIVMMDEAAYTSCLRCVISPKPLSVDSDTPELSTWFHKLIVFFMCWRALDRDSPAKKIEIAEIYKALYEEGKQRLFQLYYKGFRTEDGGGDIRPLKRTNKYRHFLTGSR